MGKMTGARAPTSESSVFFCFRCTCGAVILAHAFHIYPIDLVCLEYLDNGMIGVS